MATLAVFGDGVVNLEEVVAVTRRSSTAWEFIFRGGSGASFQTSSGETAESVLESLKEAHVGALEVGRS